MPIVNIQVLEGRSEEKIKKLMKDVTDTVSSSLEAPKERVRVIVTEVPKTHWGIAGTAASDLKNR